MRVIPICGWNHAVAVVRPDPERGEVSVDLTKLAAGRLWLKPKAAKLLLQQLKAALKEIANAK